MNHEHVKNNDNNHHHHPDSNNSISAKDILLQIGPIDDLLGSLSYNGVDTVVGKTQQIRASARVFKKMKLDTQQNTEKKEEPKVEEPKPELTPPPQAPPPKKTMAVVWSSDDKKLFFEAVNEFGKDFESIHMYMTSKLKKRTAPEDLARAEIKTKPHVRTFYYRTVHMLQNCVKFSEGLPKNVQELYILINYGEMRRKIGSITKKNWGRLNELVHKGSIALRIKGKTIKIKTPMCRALRRLNQLDEKYDDLKLPTKVTVELRPKDMESFLKVQSMAQNPRVQIAQLLQKRLTTLLTCLTERWKSADALLYEKAVIPTNPITRDCAPDPKVVQENINMLVPLLRVFPPPEVRVELPTIDISEYFTGQSISLNAFEVRKGVVKVKEELVIKSEEIDVKPENFSSTSSADQNGQTVPSASEESAKILKQVKEEQAAKAEAEHLEEVRLKIEELRRGWTLQTADTLTVGELYLMFGYDSKLMLEYCWDPPQLKLQEGEEQDVKEAEIVKKEALSNPLKKLLSLAKLHSREKPPPKCTCGHVCGSKSNPQFKKPSTSKVPKKNHNNQEHPDDKNDKDIKDNKTDKDKGREKQHINQPQPTNHAPMINLITQLDANRNKGKPRCKQLVVERKLVPIKSETHQIVSMNIIEQENKPEEPKNLPSLISSQLQNINDSTGNNTPSTSRLQDEDENNFSDLLIDSPSNSTMSTTGISKILKENENQWINSDYSLSSLLGQLDCPIKSDDSLSHDVDSQLRTLLIETSVDYTAKFADLAAQVDNKK